VHLSKAGTTEAGIAISTLRGIWAKLRALSEGAAIASRAKPKSSWWQMWLTQMVPHRPYRPALGIEVALAEIEKDGGRLFDPAMVDACITLFRQKGFRFDLR
jgi:hypothetical protein